MSNQLAHLQEAITRELREERGRNLRRMQSLRLLAITATLGVASFFGFVEGLSDWALIVPLLGGWWVAAAVLGATTPATAERLHRGVAEALDTQGSEPALVAGHWRACGEWLRAGRCYRAGADAARRAQRPVERSELLDTAAVCFERAAVQADLFDTILERLNVAEAPDRAQRRVPLMSRLDALACTPEQALRALAQRVGWHADNGR
jgi:hypothetical protein